VPIVAFVSPKGGAGKTTAAMLLALGLADEGRRVAIIDSDPNKPMMHWAGLPGRPERITVHPAPTDMDLSAAMREARARNAEWIILDTEGSVRGGMAFVSVRADLVLTPLAASSLETMQALKAAQMVREFGGRSGRGIQHACILTRVPAAVRPKSIRLVVEQLHSEGIRILPTAIIEKEAFRLIFAYGGGFDVLEANGAPGVPAARANAAAYLEAVHSFIDEAGHITAARPRQD
jgi:chromosome partitioning protein